jgi:hypothetical protein
MSVFWFSIIYLLTSVVILAWSGRLIAYIRNDVACMVVTIMVMAGYVFRTAYKYMDDPLYNHLPVAVSCSAIVATWLTCTWHQQESERKREKKEQPSSN